MHRGLDVNSPHIEALIDRESAKMMDGYHYARWIVPLVGAALGFGLFLPLALTFHPAFLIGTAAFAILGVGLGLTFHVLARRISPAQLALRQRCLKLGYRMLSFRCLFGHQPALSVGAFELLEDAARTYLAACPEPSGREHAGPAAEAAQRTRQEMENAMSQMLALAEPESLDAQEAEVANGWAVPLLEEMRAAAKALASQARRTSLADSLVTPRSSQADLASARSELEQWEAAEHEVEEARVNDGAHN